MKHPEDDFLKEILADENAPEFCSRALTSMLEVARERRRQRTVARIAVWTILPVLLLLGLTFWITTPPTPPKVSVKPSPPAPSAPASALARAEPSRIHYLTDEELLSLFPGRRVALIGRADAQKLVFVDGKAQP